MAVSTQAKTEISNPISGDYRIDVLLEDGSYRWNNPAALQSSVTVTFSFMTAAPTYAAAEDKKGFTPFTTAQKTATSQILTNISQYFNISFKEVADSASSYGQIRFGDNQQGSTSAGYAFLPDSATGDQAGDLYINNEDADNLANVTPGTYAYATLVHEIGHTLGLKHPGNYNAGEEATTTPGNYLVKTEDSTANTIMSYVDVAQSQQRDFFGRYDFLALQYLYGSRVVNSGNNTYAYANVAGQTLQIIYDSGGIDTIDVSTCTVPASIDLRDGSSCSIGSLVDGSAASNNLSLAYGTVIENVIGSPLADTIVGNASDNSLKGGAGNDTLDGGAGNDSFDGGGGIDTAIYTGKLANYTLAKSGSNYTIKDNIGADGIDTLTNVERLQFADTKLALDLDANAGTTAKLLGAVFGSSFVANKQYVGIGLSLLDGGMSYTDLMQTALNAKLGTGFSNAVEVNLLWTNLFGSAPTPAQAKQYVDLLDTRAVSTAALGVLAADQSLNLTNVGLVGLQQTGIEYS